MKTYKGRISRLKTNQIFVFGSNTQGRHGKGAALVAKQKFGAIYGQPDGLQGQSFGIITKDLTSKVQPSRTPTQIMDQISKLYKFALRNQDIDFIVAYSTELNLNFYSAEEMAKMFAYAGTIPDNIVFEENFCKIVIQYKD